MQVAADGCGHVYVNEAGFDFPGGAFALDASRWVVHAHRAETLYVDVDDPGIFSDIDDPEAYRRLVESRA